MHNVVYINDSDTPTNNITLSWQVYDGHHYSKVDLSTGITVIPTNDIPVLEDVVSSITYTENEGPKVLDSYITVTDPDNANMASATIQILGNYTPDQDMLAIDVADLKPGVTANWTDTVGSPRR